MSNYPAYQNGIGKYYFPIDILYVLRRIIFKGCLQMRDCRILFASFLLTIALTPTERCTIRVTLRRWDNISLFVILDIRGGYLMPDMTTRRLFDRLILPIGSICKN